MERVLVVCGGREKIHGICKYKPWGLGCVRGSKLRAGGKLTCEVISVSDSGI